MSGAAAAANPTPAETYAKFMDKLSATEAAARLGGGKPRVDKQVSEATAQPARALRPASVGPVPGCVLDLSA